MIRLTKLEEEILNNLWELKRAFPKVLITHLKDPKPPYNTILSVIRKMVESGYVGYKKYGKSHEYYPILEKESYGKSLFRKLYDDVLDSSKIGLLSFFMKEQNVDLDELQEMINELRDKTEGNG